MPANFSNSTATPATTLLDIVQEILSSMDSDEVNSIDDTVESSQVALVVRRAYYDLSIDLGLPEHTTLFELTASGDPTKPTLMSIPNNCHDLQWIKYNNKLSTETYSNYKEVAYLPPKDFIEMSNELKDTADGFMNILINGASFEVLYRNDAFPNYYTSADDYQVIFDSYLATEDTTLQTSKTMAYGKLYPIFILSDTFVPLINPQQFPLLINKAKEIAFGELKQMENRNATQEARRQKIVTQWNRQRIDRTEPIFKGPRYGRNR